MNPWKSGCPQQNRASFHFRGDSRELLNQIARVYGVSAQIEDSVTSRRVSFDMDGADFYQAISAADQVTKAFWAPLSEKQIVVAGDTQENRSEEHTSELQSRLHLVCRLL